jgi:hypothetical protein
MQVTKVIADVAKVSNLLNLIRAATHPAIAFQNVEEILNDFTKHLVPHQEPASTEPPQPPEA